MLDRRDEVEAKIAQVRAYLERADLDGVVLTRRGAFAWLTGGGDNHVVSTAAEGVAGVLVTRDAARVIATNIEMPRILAEELADLPFEPVVSSWFDDGPRAIARAVGGLRVAADTAVPGVPLLGPEFNRLRFALLPPEVRRVRAAGRAAADAVEEVARHARSGLTELELAGRLSETLLARGLTPAVILVAVDDRIARFRHPIPTAARLMRRAMLAVVASARGLHAALTRLVHLGPVPADLSRRHAAVTAVDAAMCAASRPGRRASEVLQAGIDAYAREGFADEWRHHHQGGPTGYAPREYVVTPATGDVLVEHQALAWNPSIAGTKSEDTFLLEAGGPEYVTLTGHWPVATVAADGHTIPRPAILEL